VRWIAALSLAGYAYLIVQFGWVGLAAAGLHIGVLLACVKR